MIEYYTRMIHNAFQKSVEINMIFAVISYFVYQPSALAYIASSAIAGIL